MARIIQTSPIGIVAVSVAGDITFANPAAEELLGLTRDSLVGPGYRPPEWRATDFEGRPFSDEALPLPRVIETGQAVHDVRHAIVWPDGRRVLLSIDAAPILDLAGEIDGVVASLRDITAQVQAERAVAESQQRLRAVIDNAPLGGYLYELHPDGRLIFADANRSADRMLGIEHAQFFGRTLEEAFPPLAQTELPAEFRRIASFGGSSEWSQVSYRDGQIEGTFEVHAFQAGPGLVTVLFRDVTERSRAEEARRESEERFRAVFDTVDDLICIKDAELRYTHVNPAAVRFFEGDTPSHSQSFPEGVADLIAEADRRALQGEVVTHTGVRLRCQSERIFDTTKVPLRDTSGRIIGVCGFARDVTERVAAARRLEESWQRTRAALNATVTALASALETRDPYTAGHQKGVARLAVALARELGLEESRIETLEIAAILHDIGKINVPAEILAKPTALTEVEVLLVRQHARAGYEILKDIPFQMPVAKIVLQHHERLDGSGYPQGLRDKDMLLEARLLAIADVVEAMASHRPYRPAKGLDAALEHLAEGRGVLYDAAGVEACVRVFGQRGFALAE